MAAIKRLIATLLVAFTALLFIFGFFHDDGQSLLASKDDQQTRAASLQDTLEGAEQAWSHLTEEAKHAVTEIKSALDHIDLDDAKKLISEIPTLTQNTIGRINVTAFEQWLEQTTEEGVATAIESLQAIDWDDLPEEALQYIKDHPLETALYIAETVVLFVPGGIYGPLLRAAGFTRVGVRARSIAALIQSKIGNVPARGWFAHLVSGMMGGYGRKLLRFWTRFGVKVGGWLGLIASQRGT